VEKSLRKRHSYAKKSRKNRSKKGVPTIFPTTKQFSKLNVSEKIIKFRKQKQAISNSVLFEKAQPLNKMNDKKTTILRVQVPPPSSNAHLLKGAAGRIRY